MIYVTHDQVEAMSMADKIAVMYCGELYQFGSPDEVYNWPVNTFVARFIGSPNMNFIKCRYQAEDGQGYLVQKAGRRARPRWTTKRRRSDRGAHHRRQSDPRHPARASEGGLPAETDPDCWEASVYAIEPLGPKTVVHLKVGERSDPGDCAFRSTAPAVGERSTSARPGRMHIFDGKTKAVIR